MQYQTGMQVGNYRLKKLLGHGGFADVYLGEHIHLGTNAAIKILHTQLVGEEIDNFRNEARTIAHLSHPHIVRVLDFDIEQQVPFFVMEYAPKGTLRQRHPRGVKLPPDTILAYLKQLASALQYAHDRKLIHRDVKPENMLIAANDTILLSDFGIALLTQSHLTTEPVANAQQDVIGTMSYMAPEQIQGQAVAASDQYSLAVVIYEWLSGRKPFTGSYYEVMSQKLSTQPPPLNPQELTVPPAVIEVIMQALRKDPRQRFASVQEFARAFELALHPPVPLPFGISPRLVTAPRKVGEGLKKGLLILGVSLALCAILACGLSYAGVNLFKFGLSGIGGGPPSDSEQATISSNNFMQALSNHNYDQAYKSFAPGLTAQVPRDQFVRAAQQEDHCDGNVVGFSQLSVSGQNTTRSYVYIVTRQRLSKSYHLNLTLQKNSQGNWQVTDYNSDVGTTSCP